MQAPWPEQPVGQEPPTMLRTRMLAHSLVVTELYTSGAAGAESVELIEEAGAVAEEREWADRTAEATFDTGED